MSRTYLSVYGWGWNYRTLEGHVEIGQMDWEVWKWLDDGSVEFRVHAVSPSARIPNPVVRLRFHLLRDRERDAFLSSTKRRRTESGEGDVSRCRAGSRGSSFRTRR